MPSFTLHYFNQRGRAEVCRMLFAASAVQYNDHRVENSEWSSFKSKVPCNQLPMLEIDNKIQIPQSMAIARYLAREFGFHGKTNIEMARVDFISDCFYDVLDDYLRMYQDKEGRMTFQKAGEVNRSSENYMRYQDTLYRILPYMEKTLEAYNNGSHYFMGEQLTVADLMFYCALENPLMEDSSMLNSYPKLQALKNRILNNSKISPYLKKRAKTEF